MSAFCNKIVFYMQEDEQKWESVIDTNIGVRDMSLDHVFLPETAEEKITITIVRITRQSEEYAAYVNSTFPKL